MADNKEMMREEMDALNEASLAANPGYTKEQLMKEQQERIWGELPGFKIYPAGTEVPKGATEPVRLPEHP